MLFQHTAARRRLEKNHQKYACHCCFNTQPPEGGWDLFLIKPIHHLGFNTQPPEGGWDDGRNRKEIQNVSTHSRPKAAGASQGFALLKYVVSTHSRPKAAG